ncbi:hypothetical protein [Novosphingobium mangrovi (ex Huang et al. 2023)]|uniref:Uncharacterized protein n=1 Tax=Novosphingobium mangrovi (ex Huang et al. 2023) TaxID=2976432 RepID=A0ABT2I9T9_9SPHN|nr:hypothetical protein [Novosphingobium mangrovi (ex Huang et al. 2023)]MCT2401595.1 hypothetical protein [Novosphingobium mangrovi (ex Huang et al. 2023)]
MSEQKRSTSGGNQPITRHPLFPAIVALWAGALFGLASIALPPALIERAVTALGVDRVIPMAAPPLGATTRILIALAMTVLGGVCGTLVARRLARPAPGKHERRRDVMPGSGKLRAAGEIAGPIVGAAAVAEDSADHAPSPGHSTPILNVGTFEVRSFDEAFEDEDDIASRAVNAQDTASETIEVEKAPASFASMPSGGPFATPTPPAGAQVFRSANASEEAAEVAEDIACDAEEEAEAVDAAGSERPAGGLFEAYSREIAPGEAPQASVLDDECADLVDTDFQDDEDDTTPIAAAEPPADIAAPSEAGASHEEDIASEAPNDGSPTAAERIVSAELDALSPVELLERLALAMAQRRAREERTATAPVLVEVDAPEAEPEPEMAGPAPVDAEPLPVEAPYFEAEAVEPQAQAETASVQEARDDAPASTSIPAAMRPVAFDDFSDEDDDDALPGYIPPRHIGLSPSSFTPSAEASFAGEDEEDEEDEEESDEQEGHGRHSGYSSLLDLSGPFANRERQKQQFVQFDASEGEETGDIQPEAAFDDEYDDDVPDAGPFAVPAPEPAPEAPAPSSLTFHQHALHDPASQVASERLFDGPGNADPEETEKALRAALATLQRMSGAA